MRKDAPIISCFHLAITASGPSKQHLLDDITLELPAASWTEIIGEPGAGKSLLFGIFSLRLEPDEGKLVFGGRNFDRLGARGVADLRRSVSSCAQRPMLLENRTVIENLMLPFVVRGEAGDWLARCEELLAQVELGARRDVAVRDLSQQERLLVGALRAIAVPSRLVLLDGVLEQITESAQRSVIRLLQERHLAGTSIIVLGREASSNAERGTIHRLTAGKLEVVGVTDDATELVA